MSQLNTAEGFERSLAKRLTELEEKWQNSTRPQTKGPSKQNWRFKKKLTISRNNTSAEKTLEKAIATHAGEDWVNQVPTASGLFTSTKDKLRNVDLVYRHGASEYSFIELKVKSNNPEYALDEVSTYGIYYVFARLYYSDSLISAKKLLRAKTIHLVVLAPRAYYRGNESELSRVANDGWSLFMKNHADLQLTIDFSFEAFPSDFEWPNPEKEFKTALINRTKIT